MEGFSPFDLWTCWHFLMGLLFWVIFQKNWKAAFFIFIGWEFLEQLVLAPMDIFWWESIANSVFDVLIESSVYLVFYNFAEKWDLLFFGESILDVFRK